MTEPTSELNNILIVDDTPENLTVLRQILSEQRYQVRPVLSGEMALKVAGKSPPDLILLDIMMPSGMDGYEVCRILKENEETADVPILFISALDETRDKVRAFQAGGVDYITKPFQTEEVLARVKTHLALRRMQKELKTQNARLMKEIGERERTETALEEINKKLEAANRELESLASMDGLTNIANRRQFDDYIRREWRRSARESIPISLIFCDIDYFKRYNDAYGHLAGDDCLKQVARKIRRSLKRPADLAARYGGEEFVILLPRTDLKGAVQLAEEVHREIETLEIAHEHSDVSPFVSVSVGVSCVVPEPESAPEILIHAADHALYKAKALGRNRIMIQEAGEEE